MREGVDFAIGTKPTDQTGGNYIAFSSPQKAIEAYRAIYRENLPNFTIADALANWVGTSEGSNYARQVIGFYQDEAGEPINRTKKISQLSDRELNNLLLAQMRKEQPNYYRAFKRQFPNIG